MRHLFQRVIATLYILLGPHLSTMLAYSRIGKFFFSFLIDSKQELAVYSTTVGIKVKLTASEAFSFGIIHLGIINKFETSVLTKILKPGNLVIDVGAYVDGWYSLLAGKLVGKKGQVYSFEPHPDFFKRLQENIKLNNLTNVIPIKLGVSGRNGMAKFYAAGLASSLHKSQAYTYVENAREITIKTCTLDHFIKQRGIKKIKLIKIDVEGAEMQVLQGASTILQLKDAPDLIVEVIDKQLRLAGSSALKLITYLERFGYNPYMFTAHGLVEYTRQKKSPTLNLYFSKLADAKMKM